MQGVIIAAGESSRCWPLSKQHKSRISVFGKPLLYWTIKGMAREGIRNIAVVSRPDSGLEKELESLAAELNLQLSLVVQEQPLGTGDAIFRASDIIKEPFFVFWPYKISSGEIVRRVLEKKKTENCDVVLVGSKTATPWDYGIVKFEGDKVAEIVENPKPGQEPSDIKTVGAYFLEPDFFACWRKIKKHHPEDFIDALNLYIKDKKTGLLVLEKEPSRLKYTWEFLTIMKEVFELDEFRPSVSPTAVLGRNVTVEGKVFIDDNAVIGENTFISGPCFVGKNCKIGASNVLRGPVNLESNVNTGAFMEIKNSLIQAGTHFHSGYCGDSVIGRDCRFGAGFITANRRIDRKNISATVKDKKVDTGLTYFGTAVGQNTRFGIRAGTMPGVAIGSDSTIGPGTLVFENVEDRTVLYAQFKNIVKKEK